MNHNESRIQSDIVRYLQSIGVYAFSVPNERASSARDMMRLISMGLRSGVADLIVLLPGGKTVFLEVKTDKGRQSDNQKRFQERVEHLGFKYFVVRSIKDVDTAISSC